MGWNTPLSQGHFTTDANGQPRNWHLRPSDQAAFLALQDAGGHPKPTRAVYAKYQMSGLRDVGGTQRVVRPVTIPAGTRVYKLTGGLEKHEPAGPLKAGPQLDALIRSELLFKNDTMSPWWAPVDHFEEDTGGIREHFGNMVLNATAFAGPGKLTLREYARFMSAVTLEWNKLSYYVELELSKAVHAYWGQFEEQVGISDAAKLTRADNSAAWGDGEQVRIVQDGSDRYIHYRNESGHKYYLPEHLGGMEAWQFYIPKFEKTDIHQDRIRAIPATDTEALAAHFGMGHVVAEAHAQVAQFKQFQKMAASPPSATAETAPVSGARHGANRA